MKIYNLPLNMDCIEIFYFKKFKLPKKLKMLKSHNFYDALLESIDNNMFYVYKINELFYSTQELDIDENQNYQSELFILNIPNIYINENKISYIVNILDFSIFKITKKHVYNVENIYIYFDDVDIIKKNEKDLKIRSFDFMDKNRDNSKFDIIISNKSTSFIGMNPNTQFIYKNNNITNLYVSKIFNILKIICLIELFFDYKNIYILNSDSELFENCDINTIYSKNTKNVSIDSIMNIIDILKNSDKFFHI